MSVLAPSAYTTAQVIADARQHLLTGGRDELNKLAIAIDADDTLLTFTYVLGGIRAGVRLSIGLEDMYVWAADGMVATVERAQFGTSADSHGVGALVSVKPHFSDAEVVRDMNKELADLSTPTNALFKVVTTDIDWSPTVSGYALPAGLIDIVDIRWRHTGPEKLWTTVQYWEIAQGQDTTDFASGIALFVRDNLDPATTLRVSYKTAFTPTTTLADNIVTVTGLPASAVDILAMGTAIRVAAGREIRRNQTAAQGDTRRAEEVPPGAVLGSTRTLIGLRAQRIAAEAARLADLYPTQRRHRRFGQ